MFCQMDLGPCKGSVAYTTRQRQLKKLRLQKIKAEAAKPHNEEKLGYSGESSVQVAPAKKENVVARQALDQSSRYANLSLDEDTLIRRMALKARFMLPCFHVELKVLA